MVTLVQSSWLLRWIRGDRLEAGGRWVHAAATEVGGGCSPVLHGLQWAGDRQYRDWLAMGWGSSVPWWLAMLDLYKNSIKKIEKKQKKCTKKKSGKKKNEAIWSHTCMAAGFFF